MGWITHLVIGVLMFGVGIVVGRGSADPAGPGSTGGASPGETPAAEAPAAATAPTEPSAEASTGERVTGLGGVFFKSADPEATLAWYREHLGIEPNDFGGFAFQWRERDEPEEVGYTVWGAFTESTEYFAPSTLPYMFNFRVRDLEALLPLLRAEGVQIAGEIEEHPNGKFAWIVDPDGRKIELWQPVPSSRDPYL